MTETPDERRKRKRREASARWLAKPGNLEKHRAAVRRCHQRPSAKETHRKQSAARAATIREQERLRAAQWRQDHPEKVRRSHRVYYLKNRNKVRAKTTAYRNANKAVYAEYSRQYKAAKRAGGGRLSRGWFDRLMREQGGLCKACGADLTIVGSHLDHIQAITKGGLHCDANVQLLCPTCNRRKSAKNFEDFLAELALEKAA